MAGPVAMTALGRKIALSPRIQVLIRSRTEKPVLETVIALVTPYAPYVLAENLHISGPASPRSR
ncbi:hypothetical protein [Streptomyces rimosus]|uniref:hypothetical protein n=1 Tax=Streptomyces rimosus TaxID=1927 RepID=UPI001F3F2D83|nr:hypothetical protein [Streptomyces rimosus]